jgi:hypothetical protein
MEPRIHADIFNIQKSTALTSASSAAYTLISEVTLEKISFEKGCYISGKRGRGQVYCPCMSSAAEDPVKNCVNTVE